MVSMFSDYALRTHVYVTTFIRFAQNNSIGITTHAVTIIYSGVLYVVISRQFLVSV
jgi:hypothetical protein